MLRKPGLFIFVFALIMALTSNFAYAMTVEEIMQKVDDFQYSKSIKMEAEMLIVNGKRKMTKNMVTVGEGTSALTEFTNPRDRGTKFLKVGDDLWLFFPDAEEIVKLSGHMLEQGMMGSDFSYQDAMESEKLTDLYNFEILREEDLDGRPCYVIEGIAKEGAKVSYYRRMIWVDQERFVGLKEEMYAQSGRLLKEMKTLKVEQIEERWYTTHMIMENKLKKNTRTEFKILSIEFDVEIPEDTFSLQNLR